MTEQLLSMMGIFFWPCTVLCPTTPPGCRVTGLPMNSDRQDHKKS